MTDNPITRTQNCTLERGFWWLSRLASAWRQQGLVSLKTDFRCAGFIIKLSRLHPKEEFN